LVKTPGWLTLGSLVLLTLLVGCSPGSQLIGTWEVDTAKIQPAGGASNPLAAMASGMLSMVKVQTEFKADGEYAMTFSMLGQERSDHGTWRYDRTEGDDLVVKIKTSSVPNEQELRIHFIDREHLEMIPPGPATEGQAMPFKRVSGSKS
jgi:hypothetical protein